MPHFPSSRIVLFVALSVMGVNAAASRWRGCPETLDNGNSIANELQSKFWDSASGSYTDGELWTDANTLEDLHNLMLATGSNTYGAIADNSYIGQAALNPFTNWDLFFGGSYDDAQWVILALWKIRDYKEYEWLLNSGTRGPDGLFNDGLDLSTCKNNGQTTWTYNQAVIASGLGALYVAVHNTTFLEQAQVSLDATMHSVLTDDNGVLRESCDDVPPGSSPCDEDQQLFKGLWTKHVQYFLDAAHDTSIADKYGDFLWSQYAAVWGNARNATDDVGSVWYSPDQGRSEWGPQASASGLEAVVSAAKHAPCKSL